MSKLDKIAHLSGFPRTDHIVRCTDTWYKKLYFSERRTYARWDETVRTEFLLTILHRLKIFTGE